MARKNALHFEIHTNNAKPYGYIRNSYREDRKIKHDTIARIPGCTLEQLKAMKAAFNGASEPVSLSDLKFESGREYGASAALFFLAKKIGLDKLIYSRNDEWVKSSLALIIARIIYQGSKLYASRLPELSSLWEICGVDGRVDVDRHCYDAMDELLKRQEIIQKKLAARHFVDGCAVLYDITSSYLEGEYEDSDYVKFGYNRDKKRGKKQIVIGLICTKNGCPVAVEVYSGNTNDGSTVTEKVREIREKYGLEKFVFVGDRGMLTQTNIDKLPENISSITALTHSAMRKLVEDNECVQLSMFDTEVGAEVVLPKQPNVRYVLRRNPIRAQKDADSRERLLVETEKNLEKIANPKRKATDAKLGERYGRILDKYRTRKYFDVQIKEGRVDFRRKLDKINEDAQYDGLYVIRGEVESAEMTTYEVVEAYKSLIQVEQAFRRMKSVQLEIRPIYHHTDDRIKAHVFLCMLAYYLFWHFRRAVEPLKQSKPDRTIDELLGLLKLQQNCKFTLSDIECYKLAEPNERQQEILDLLKNYTP